MTVSTDERREVAARLRTKHSERQGTFEPQSISIQAMNRMEDLLDCLPKRSDMLLDLADLIEPDPERTCQMVDIPDGWEDADGVIWPDCWVCDTCGSYTLGVLSHPHTIDTPSYCPNCGARVVE